MRCHSFHIPSGTVLAIKKIAGNIIPALASTNAIVAGIQVLTAVKLLNLQSKSPSEQAKEMRYSYLLKVKTNKVIIYKEYKIESVTSVCHPVTSLFQLSHM